jgi:hypothetical protein
MQKNKAFALHLRTSLIVYVLIILYYFFNLTGAAIGMVDLHVYPWFERLVALKTTLGEDLLDSLASLQAWQQRMEEAPCVRETMLPSDWHLQFFLSLAQRNPQYDIGLPDGDAKL